MTTAQLVESFNKACPCKQCAYDYAKASPRACPFLLEDGDQCGTRLAWQNIVTWGTMILDTMDQFKFACDEIRKEEKEKESL